MLYPIVALHLSAYAVEHFARILQKPPNVSPDLLFKPLGPDVGGAVRASLRHPRAEVGDAGVVGAPLALRGSGVARATVTADSALHESREQVLPIPLPLVVAALTLCKGGLGL